MTASSRRPPDRGPRPSPTAHVAAGPARRAPRAAKPARAALLAAAGAVLAALAAPAAAAPPMALPKATANLPMVSNALAKPPESPEWSSTAGMGGSTTRGNSDTQALDLNGRAEYAAPEWEWRAYGGARWAEADGETRAENYALGTALLRRLTERDLLFARWDWERDLFGAFDVINSILAGPAQRLIDREGVFLELEEGVGVRQRVERATQRRQSETVSRLGLTGEWALGRGASLREEAFFLFGEDFNTRASNTTISSPIGGAFNLEASLETRHVSRVPTGFERDDVRTVVRFIGNWGGGP